MAGNIPEFSLISNVFIVIVLLFVVSVKYDIQNWSKTYNLFGKLNVKMESEARKEKIAEKQQITYKDPQNQFKVFHSLLWRRAHSFHYFGIHIQSQYHNEIKRIVGTGIQHAYLNRSVDISDDKGKNNKNKAIFMEIGQVACMAEHWKLEHCKRFAEFSRFFFWFYFYFDQLWLIVSRLATQTKCYRWNQCIFPECIFLAHLLIVVLRWCRIHKWNVIWQNNQFSDVFEISRQLAVSLPERCICFSIDEYAFGRCPSSHSINIARTTDCPITVCDVIPF